MSETPTVTDRPGGDRDDAVPWMVDRFVVEDELGAGGMGRVYLAYDPSLDRQVAIKLLRDEPSLDVEKAHVRMAREARAMARLRHPNVVTVYEVGTHEGRVFIVMEYVAGGTLRDWVNAGGDTLAWQAIVEMFVLAGRGLEAAHAAGLVHRDFKPDNVLVERDTHRVLVSDFGIAAVYGDDVARSTGDRDPVASVTRTGTLIGTPPYMSPEQHRANPTDARADQFSFCAALYEALFGVRPFAGTDLDEISVNAIHHRITPPRIDRGVPARITAAITRGLQPDAAARFPSMSALLAELTVIRRTTRWIAAAAGATAIAAAGIAWIETREPAIAHAVTCDCEVFTIDAPAGTRVVGYAPIPPVGAAMRVPIAARELAIPRGHHTIDYEAGGAVYSLAIESKGIGAVRTIVLPVPELRPGYAFVPGGEVSIGDLAGDGAADERPAATVRLAPYLIAIRDEADLVAYDKALEVARAANARLPTAAEWEWAARLGVVQRALANQWEWTATRFAPYPYDENRDDPFAEGTTVEVRGGQVEGCDAGDERAGPCAGQPGDRARPSRRLEGQRAGVAELRLARTARAMAPLAVQVRLVDREVDPRDRAKLHRFVFERPGALLVETGGNPGCLFFGALAIDQHLVEVVRRDDLPADIAAIRVHPDPAYRNPEGRVVCTDTSIEILDVVCFDGDQLVPASDRTIAAIAETLVSHPALKKIELGDYVGYGTDDAMAVSARRAALVRTKLIAAGVGAARLVAQGYGAETQRETEQQRHNSLLRSGACASGGRVQLLVLERDPGLE